MSCRIPVALRTIPAVLFILACTSLLPRPVRAQMTTVGDAVKYSASTPHPYESGGWSVIIEHPGATYIAVHFERFELGPADRVVVRSPSDKQHWEYDGKGRGGLGTFWAVHIKGEAAIVELIDNAAEGGGWGVSIDRYAAGFVDMGAESICGADDKQPEKRPWRAISVSVISS